MFGFVEKRSHWAHWCHCQKSCILVCVHALLWSWTLSSSFCWLLMTISCYISSLGFTLVCSIHLGSKP